MPEVTIPEQLAANLMAYLAKRPFDEVFHFMNQLQMSVQAAHNNRAAAAAQGQQPQ